MAISPEYPKEQPLVQEIPDSADVPPELEQGISSVPTSHTNIPQASDLASQQITPVPPPSNPNGPNIILPDEPQALKKATKGSPNDASTWSAFYWLRMFKKAVQNKIEVIVKRKND